MKRGVRLGLRENWSVVLQARCSSREVRCVASSYSMYSCANERLQRIFRSLSSCERLVWIGLPDVGLAARKSDRARHLFGRRRIEVSFQDISGF